MRARARALAGQLRPKLPRAPAGKTFFFPFERARARGVSRWAFSCRARASAHARSLAWPWSVRPARGWGANRFVGRVLPQYPQGRSSGAPILGLALHIASECRHTRRTRPLSGAQSSQVTGAAPALRRRTRPSFPPTRRAGMPECVGIPVWSPPSVVGVSGALPSTGVSSPGRGRPLEAMIPIIYSLIAHS